MPLSRLFVAALLLAGCSDRNHCIEEAAETCVDFPISSEVFCLAEPGACPAEYAIACNDAPSEGSGFNTYAVTEADCPVE